jgi:RimJ/RimL family protein N-acetyltransferase
VRIETPRLILRRWSSADIDALTEISATPEQDEVGWVIAADRWGEGLATEAAVAAIADAFDRVGLERIISWTTPDNLSSRRVMEKCGLTYRGRADWKGNEHVWYDVWHDR